MMLAVGSAPEAEVLIIGGGILGLASACHATARGLRTVIVDQYGLRNDINSSKGVERMFRLMQDNVQETRLAVSALKSWQALQAASGCRLLAMDTLIFFGHRDAPMTTEGNIRQVRQSLDRMQMAYQYLASPRAIHQRFPVFRTQAMPADYAGIVQADSASIDVQAASAALLQAAMASGRLQVIQGRKVVQTAYVQNGSAEGEYRIFADDGQPSLLARGRHLIVCPGIWADAALSGLGLKQAPQWKIWQMHFAYWQLRAAQPRLPIWFEFGNQDASDHGTFYGFPDLDFAPALRHSVKMSADYTRDIFDSPEHVTARVDGALLDELCDHLADLLDARVLDARRYHHAGTCLYSMSPDGKMVVGRIPRAPEAQACHPRAAMCVMESGRGFKYAPLFGRILVELAVDGHSSHEADLEVFSPRRAGLFTAT